MNRATQLFENRAVTLSKKGVIVSIGCNSVKDADILYEWLESLSIPQAVKEAIQHIDSARQRAKKICLNCHVTLRKLTDKQRNIVYEYYCSQLGHERVKMQDINKRIFLVFT